MGDDRNVHAWMSVVITVDTHGELIQSLYLLSQLY